MYLKFFLLNISEALWFLSERISKDVQVKHEHWHQ